MSIILYIIYVVQIIKKNKKKIFYIPQFWPKNYNGMGLKHGKTH